MVNATGPWAEDVLEAKIDNGGKAKYKIRLVKGSHLVVPRLYDAEHAYILQNPDGRVVFVLPFQDNYSLLGTTEIAFGATRTKPGTSVTPSTPTGETGISGRRNLVLRGCQAVVRRRFRRPIGNEQGIRP